MTCELGSHGEFYRTNRNSPDFYRNSTEILPEFKNFTGIQKFYRNSDRIPENRYVGSFNYVIVGTDVLIV